MGCVYSRESVLTENDEADHPESHMKLLSIKYN